MGRSVILLTKIVTQTSHFTIDHTETDPDKIADIAWNRFNKNEPIKKAEYTTKIDSYA